MKKYITVSILIAFVMITATNTVAFLETSLPECDDTLDACLEAAANPDACPPPILNDCSLCGSTETCSACDQSNDPARRAHSDCLNAQPTENDCRADHKQCKHIIQTRCDNDFTFCSKSLDSDGGACQNRMPTTQNIKECANAREECRNAFELCLDPTKIVTTDCETNNDCKLIYSSCDCEAVPITDPRTNLQDPISLNCIANTCTIKKTTASCKQNKCEKSNLNDDTDQDGITDQDEIDLGTDPNNQDTDGDGINDGDEISTGLDPLNPDSDGDGASDGEEVDNGSDPNNPDTDGDGASDGEEINAGSDPSDPSSTPSNPGSGGGGGTKNQICDITFKENRFHVCYFDGRNPVLDAQTALFQTDEILKIRDDGSTLAINHRFGFTEIAKTGKDDEVFGIWRASIDFPPGDYVFTTISDDGVRVNIEGFGNIIENFNTHPEKIDNSETLPIPPGKRKVTVEWFEALGKGTIEFSWKSDDPSNQCPLFLKTNQQKLQKYAKELKEFAIGNINKQDMFALLRSPHECKTCNTDNDCKIVNINNKFLFEKNHLGSCCGNDPQIACTATDTNFPHFKALNENWFNRQKQQNCQIPAMDMKTCGPALICSTTAPIINHKAECKMNTCVKVPLPGTFLT